MKEVDGSLIDRKESLLALTPALMPTIERWGYPNMQAICNDVLSME